MYMRSILFISTFLVTAPYVLADNSLNWWQQDGEHWYVTQEQKPGMPDTLFQRTKLIAHLTKRSGQTKVWFTTSNCRKVSTKPVTMTWKINGQEVLLRKNCKNGKLKMEPTSPADNNKVVSVFESNPYVTIRGTDNNPTLSANQTITFSSNNLSYALTRL